MVTTGSITPPSRFCTSCGVHALPGDRYCNACGAALRPTGESSSTEAGDHTSATPEEQDRPHPKSSNGSASHQWGEVLERVADKIGKVLAAAFCIWIAIFVVTLVAFPDSAESVLNFPGLHWKSAGIFLLILIAGWSVLETLDMPAWENLVNGSYGLTKTFWLFYFLPTLAFGVAIQEIASNPVAILLAVIGTTWQLLCIIGVWNAANRYRGSVAFALLAKGFVVIFAILSILSAIAAIPYLAAYLNRFA